jgi:hypothetical protein
MDCDDDMAIVVIQCDSNRQINTYQRTFALLCGGQEKSIITAFNQADGISVPDEKALS